VAVAVAVVPWEASQQASRLRQMQFFERALTKSRVSSTRDG
jgi:hypothetical protein